MRTRSVSACLVVASSLFAFPAVVAAGMEDSIDDVALADCLARSPEKFKKLLADPAKYRMQILVSEVMEAGMGARLRRFGYRVDAEYFYPASAIKTCAAVA